MAVDFYEDLDLKYAEIGIAMSAIDRLNPGSIPFSIPVLTPNMSTSTSTTNTVIQVSKTSLTNTDSTGVDVSSISISNYINITIPRELCALPGTTYDVEGTLAMSGTYKIDSGTVSIEDASASVTSLNASGSISTLTDSINVSGSISNIDINNGDISGTVLFDTEQDQANVQGTLTLTPTTERYIPSGSQWVIMFIGGDITMPRVVARLP